MAAKLSSLKIDPKKRDDGVWFEYEAGIRLRVARINNSEFVSAFNAIRVGPKGLRFNLATASVEEITSSANDGGHSFARVVAKYLLRDWSGVLDDDGKPYEYTPERALEVMIDTGHEEFLDHILKMARATEAFRVDDVKAALGNSSAVSNGVSNTEPSRQPLQTV